MTVATTMSSLASSWTTTSSAAQPPAQSGGEAIEVGKEAGPASPLGLVEPAQGVEGLRYRRDPGWSDGRAFRREAVGGATEVPAELRGEGGPIGLCTVGQRREGGHGERLAANRAGQGFNQP